MSLSNMNIALRRFAMAGLLTTCALSLTACTIAPHLPQTELVLPKEIALLSGSSKTLNYTPWYIHTWEISGPPGTGVGGGGPNVMPASSADSPSGGGKDMCCASIAHDWQPDQTYAVRWLVFKDVKKLGAKAPGIWLKADSVRFAQYDGHQAGDIWALFLPGDRVRLMVSGNNIHGENGLNHRPPDTDPYIAQGVPDDEWNRLYPNGDAQ